MKRETTLETAIASFERTAKAIVGPHSERDRLSGYDRGYTDAMRYVVNVLKALSDETRGKDGGHGE